ncbi:hypothetical protein QOZ80_6AG0507390 [Eleusine coracana subsp. coracana]|nr:hypothetical protein QOZ80_6AG0507390 [Eleusine coracana subsp. coracana]
METFVSTMAFCEAPFDGTLAPPVPAGHGAADSHPEKRGGGGDAVTVASLVAAVAEAAKHFLSNQPPEQQQEQQQETVDGLAIFETVVLQ